MALQLVDKSQCSMDNLKQALMQELAVRVYRIKEGLVRSKSLSFTNKIHKIRSRTCIKKLIKK